MRRGILLGLGLAGAVAAHAEARAQFATDRPPTSPTTPTPPTTPAPAGTPTAQPAAQPTTPGSAHPWYVRPEYGAWMISVKSYSGPSAQQHAEMLAAEIRETYRAGAYLFEWGAEDRQKEEERRQLVRQKAMEMNAPFLQVQKQLKEKAAKEGSVFIDTPAKFRYGKVEYTEQWAVLIGGFKDMDSAHRALTQIVRKWDAPKNTSLLEQAWIARPETKKSESAFLNPYKSAMVVSNPSVPKTASGPPVDPALAKFNEEESLSLLQARKPWTLMVKRFAAPARVQGRDNSIAVVDKLFGTDETVRALELNAKQARALASTLRDERMKPAPLDAFVLHTRTDSVVTVGQFDGPDDPTLLETWKVLNGMTFQLDYKDGRAPERRKMFDAIIPMQVPRVN